MLCSDPSGFPGFTDKLHKMGIKFGIYGAASGVTCGVDPGQLYNEARDAETYAAWGVVSTTPLPTPRRNLISTCSSDRLRVLTRTTSRATTVRVTRWILLCVSAPCGTA